MKYSLQTLQLDSALRKLTSLKLTHSAQVARAHVPAWKRQRIIHRRGILTTATKISRSLAARVEVQSTRVKVHIICFLSSSRPSKDSLKSYNVNFCTSTYIQFKTNVYIYG